MNVLPEELHDKEKRDAYAAACRRIHNRPYLIVCLYTLGGFCLFTIAHLLFGVEAAHRRVAPVAAVVICLELIALWHRAQVTLWRPLYSLNVMSCIVVLRFLPCGYFAFEALSLFLWCPANQKCSVWDAVLCVPACFAAGKQAQYMILRDIRLRRAEVAERLEAELGARKMNISSLYTCCSLCYNLLTELHP